MLKIKQIRWYEIMLLDDTLRFVDKGVIYNFRFFIIVDKVIYIKHGNYFVNIKKNERLYLS